MAVSKKIKNMVKSCEDLKLQVELLQTTINKVVLKNELLSNENAVQGKLLKQLVSLLTLNPGNKYCDRFHQSCAISHSKYNYIKPSQPEVAPIRNDAVDDVKKNLFPNNASPKPLTPKLPISKKSYQSPKNSHYYNNSRSFDDFRTPLSSRGGEGNTVKLYPKSQSTTVISSPERLEENTVISFPEAASNTVSPDDELPEDEDDIDIEELIRNGTIDRKEYIKAFLSGLNVEPDENGFFDRNEVASAFKAYGYSTDHEESYSDKELAYDDDAASWSSNQEE